VERYRDHGSKSASGIRICSLPAKQVILDLPITDEKARELPMNMWESEVMLASFAADRIAYVVNEKKKIHLFPLGLKTAVNEGNFATPGKRFERKLSGDWRERRPNPKLSTRPAL
jgi:hypothetical protein